MTESEILLFLSRYPHVRDQRGRVAFLRSDVITMIQELQKSQAINEPLQTTAFKEKEV